MKKKIKILTQGILPTEGFIYGPILTPYMETVENIFKYLTLGVEVVEVLEDGKEIPLKIENFDQDNTHGKKSKKSQHKEKEPVEVTPTEEPVVEEEAVEEPVEDELTPVEELVEVEEAVVEEEVTEETEEETEEKPKSKKSKKK